MIHRLIIIIISLLVLCIYVQANEHVTSAVVRIPSHGASATVIYTTSRKTFILGCAHAYTGQNKYKAMVIDVPSPSSGTRGSSNPKLIAVDYNADLSLVSLDVGPLPYVCYVGSDITRLGRCYSVGYDNMKLPDPGKPPVYTANVITTQGQTTYTVEKPWHGRSGGALIDQQTNRLVGVVQGYENGPGGRGMYVSHRAILRFIESNMIKLNGSPPSYQSSPRYYELRDQTEDYNRLNEYLRLYKTQPKTAPGHSPGGT